MNNNIDLYTNDINYISNSTYYKTLNKKINLINNRIILKIFLISILY